MIRRALLPALAGLLVAALPSRLAAQQGLYSAASIAGGVEFKQYNFGNGFGVDRLSQVAFPVGVAVPIGRRFTVDIGTQYAITSVADTSGGHSSFSSLTDTQLRGAYTFGTDALVASLVINLPTGKQTTTLQQFGVSSSASSNFLLFPVNSYGSGVSVTPGVAAATTAGGWNLGAAASIRFNGEYQPFSGAGNTGLKYQPGVEARFRVGADRLVGPSRLSMGLTFSTFGTDELRGGGLGNGAFDPGNRILVDLGLLSPVGTGTMSIYLWNYYRGTSGSGATSSGNKEDVLTGGVSGSFPLSPKMTIEPLVEARFWIPEEGSGRLLGAGSSLRIALSPVLALIPGARVDLGSIRAPLATSRQSITGWSLSTFLQYTFK
ncbi:MAG: hypothetical protein ABI587_05010 [Gemmatimonadales bacterium]